jgi:hypothetical protein
MRALLRRVLVGTPQPIPARLLWPLVALTCLVVSTVGYAAGFVTVSGGVVWLPGFAAALGAGCAAVVGYCRGGVVAAWAVTVSSLLGYHVSRAVSGDTVGDRAAALLRPDALGYFAVVAVLVMIVPFVLGSALRRGVDSARAAGGRPAE